MLGCESMEELTLWDKESYGEMDAFYSHDLTSIVIRLIAADNRITQKEVDYLNALLGFTYTVAELQEVYESCKEDIGRSFDEKFVNGISIMRKINSRLADAYKELLALVCQVIMESDGIIAGPEVWELTRLQQMCRE